MKGAGSSQVSWVKDSFESSGILSARSRLFHYIKIRIRKTPETQRFRGFWRRSRDLNPGCDYSHYSLSRGAPSATWVLPQMSKFFSRCSIWRREWDSNPRMLSHRRFSRPVLSTTQPSLRACKSIFNSDAGHILPHCVPAVNGFLRSGSKKCVGLQYILDNWIKRV